MEWQDLTNAIGSSWQDITLAVGAIIFSIALLPTVFSDEKPAWPTSAMTGSTLYIIAFTYVTLDLTFAATTTAASASLWTVILIQSLIKKRRAKRDT